MKSTQISQLIRDQKEAALVLGQWLREEAATRAPIMGLYFVGRSLYYGRDTLLAKHYPRDRVILINDYMCGHNAATTIRLRMVRTAARHEACQTFNVPKLDDHSANIGWYLARAREYRAKALCVSSTTAARAALLRSHEVMCELFRYCDAFELNAPDVTGEWVGTSAELMLAYKHADIIRKALAKRDKAIRDVLSREKSNAY